MKYLVDTHICFWAIFEKEKLSANVTSILENFNHEILVSQVSLWEIAIKYQIGKLPDFKVQMSDFINAIGLIGLRLLPLKNDYFISYFNCPYFTNNHKDSFDRLLIAFADFEKANFITKDEKFLAYSNEVNIIW